MISTQVTLPSGETTGIPNPSIVHRKARAAATAPDRGDRAPRGCPHLGSGSANRSHLAELHTKPGVGYFRRGGSMVTNSVAEGETDSVADNTNVIL